MGDRSTPHRKARALRNRALLGAGVFFTALGLTGAPPTLAQDDDGGLRMSFGLQSTLRSQSNYSMTPAGSGRGTTFDTDLSFRLNSKTRAQSLDLQLGAVARMARLPAPAGNVSGVEDPSLRLSYSREGARSRLTFSGNYRRADLDFLNPLADPILIDDPSAVNGVSLVNQTGSRDSLQMNPGFVTGIDMPVGLSLQASTRRIDYSGTVSPSLYDTQRDTVSGRLRLDLTPTTELGLSLSSSTNRSSNTTSTRQTSQNAGLDLAHQVGERLTLSANLGYSQTETRQTVLGAPVVTAREGMTFGLGVRQALPTGNIGVNYARSVDANGNRDTVNLTYARQMQTLKINLGVGLTRGVAGTTATTASASATQELARGAITFSLDRSVSTNDSLQDVLATRARLNVRHNITETSGVDFGVSYARNEDGGSGALATTSRSSVTMAYRHKLTKDWNLRTGIEHRHQTTAAGTATGNTFFVTLGRSFEYRP